ncbi:MAG TPA: hypothetical protein VGD22_02825 [Sphingobacteriaceae bacterium]
MQNKSSVKSDDKFKDLGNQIMEGSIQGGTFYIDEKTGREYAYTVSRGKPAHLLGYELRTGKIIADFPLEKEIGSWDLEVSSDGWLYIAGNTGHVYQHRPGTNQVTDLGKFLNESLVFDLTTGKKGEIFGGTYNSSRVFRYHPDDGFSDVGKSSMVAGEQYVRSLVYHARTSKLYAGVGAHASLIELDPQTGTKKQILPAEFREFPFVYNMSLVSGLSDGDRLFAWLHSGDKHQTLMYNLETGNITQKSGLIQVRSIIKDLNNDTIFYIESGKLFSEDIKNSNSAPDLLATFQDSMIVDAMWGKDKKLYFLSCNRRILNYDPITRGSSATDIEIPPQPIKINSLVAGPDGRIWTGGYLTGGHAAYNPRTGKIKQYPGIDQAEGMTVQGTNIFMGIYPSAKIYQYNTKRRWDPDNGNPRLIKQIFGQDRPYAGVSAEDVGKMFFGTVPRYGTLGGTLLEYNIATDEMLTFHNVVTDQSVVSLVYAGGSIYGGTTVRGGMGVPPATTEAKLFGWDIGAKTKNFQIVPVVGARAITCLINGPQGNVWGIADGVLFIFDPLKRTIISKKVLYPVTQGRDGVYYEARLALHPSGIVYGVGGGSLFQINPENMEYQELKKGARLLTMDKNGLLCTVINETLWTYQP